MNKAVKSQKLPALFVLICFLSGELFRPAGVMAAMPLPITEVAAAAAFQLELPPELGTVEMLVSGQGPTVIHIQEAHGDYESQLKIESILHFLKDRYGVDLLLLEGNAFKLHSELLNFFPGREDLNRSILEAIVLPAFERKALILTERRVTTDKIGQCTFVTGSEGLFA